MTSNEYEVRYLEALSALRANGHAIEDPSRSSGGQRYVRVDGVALNDDSVFEAAWGQIAAERLRKLRSTSGS